MNAKQLKKIHIWIRAIIQLLYFIFIPSVYTAAFAGVKYIFTQIGAGEKVALTSFVTVLIVVCIYTAVFGRFFCGFACAFGSLGDGVNALYRLICKKMKKKPVQIPDRIADRLVYLKYVILAIIVFMCYGGVYNKAQGTSPWDVFSMLTARKLPNASYKIGIILLVLILIGMCTQERFFCQFLCPMGAVFAMMPILPSALFNRNREKCPSKCGLCRKRCPAHLEIDGDTPLSGECICCHACQVTCPRKNIQIGPIDTAQEAQ